VLRIRFIAATVERMSDDRSLRYFMLRKLAAIYTALRSVAATFKCDERWLTQRHRLIGYFVALFFCGLRSADFDGRYNSTPTVPPGPKGVTLRTLIGSYATS